MENRILVVVRECKFDKVVACPRRAIAIQLEIDITYFANVSPSSHPIATRIVSQRSTLIRSLRKR